MICLLKKMWQWLFSYVCTKRFKWVKEFIYEMDTARSCLVFRMNVSRDVGFPCLSWRTQHRPSKSLPFNIFPPCSLCPEFSKPVFIVNWTWSFILTLIPRCLLPGRIKMNIDSLSIKNHHYHNSFIHSLTPKLINSIYILPNRTVDTVLEHYGKQLRNSLCCTEVHGPEWRKALTKYN